MAIPKDILAYHAAQTPGDRRICDALARLIDSNLHGAECKVWHRHPVWFLDGNPIVGYSKLKDCIRLLFWSGQSFDEPGLTPEGSFKAAEARYTDAAQIKAGDLGRWLAKSIAIQWDYKNIVKRKGRLVRLPGAPEGLDVPKSKPKSFSAEEKAAMKERAAELKAEAKAGKSRAEGDKAVRAAIAALPQPDRALGERFHAIVTANAPGLMPKLWYGMPAYANADGKVVCFFQAATKFKTRYASFAFTDQAVLDDDGVWATGFGVKALAAPDEARFAALVRKAVG